MTRDSVLEILDDRTFLQTERLRHGQDALHKAATLGALTAKAATTPQHRSALHALGVVVGRFHSFLHDKSPHGQVLVHQARAEEKENTAGKGKQDAADAARKP